MLSLSLRSNRFARSALPITFAMVFLAAAVVAGALPAIAAGRGVIGVCNPLLQTCTVGVGGGGSGGSGGSGGGSGGGGTVSPGCHNTDPENGCDPCPAGMPMSKTPDPAACL